MDAGAQDVADDIDVGVVRRRHDHGVAEAARQEVTMVGEDGDVVTR